MNRVFTKTDLHQKYKTRKVSPQFFLQSTQSTLNTVTFSTTIPSGD